MASDSCSGDDCGVCDDLENALLRHARRWARCSDAHRSEFAGLHAGDYSHEEVNYWLTEGRKAWDMLKATAHAYGKHLG